MSQYNGTNKRSVDAFKAENGNAQFNMIDSTTGKTYKNGKTMLFFSCAGSTGYVTEKANDKLEAAGADWQTALKGMLIVDHEVNGKTLPCLEVDSPNARYSY